MFVYLFVYEQVRQLQLNKRQSDMQKKVRMIFMKPDELLRFWLNLFNELSCSLSNSFVDFYAKV